MAAEHGTDKQYAINFKTSLRPQVILLFSGKRKSGKDFITNALHEKIGSASSVIIRLSGPIKSHWAKSLDLDINQLLGDGKYKESYRLEMVKWGESMRKKDNGYFCRAALDMYNECVHIKLISDMYKFFKAYSKPLWIVSDIRRKTDIQWFKQNFEGICKTIRIVSDNLIREKRGWAFIPGIDDSETECDLDDIKSWDLEVTNNDDNIEYILQQILRLIN